MFYNESNKIIRLSSRVELSSTILYMALHNSLPRSKKKKHVSYCLFFTGRRILRLNALWRAKLVPIKAAKVENGPER